MTRYSIGTMLAVIVLAQAFAQTPTVVYQSDFDGFVLGPTIPDPGDPAQDDWIDAYSNFPAFGEFQNLIANGGTALHQKIGIANPTGQQKIDIRRLLSPDLSAEPIVRFSIDFLVKSNDYATKNGLDVGAYVLGGPHPGFAMIGFRLTGGGGVEKSATGVGVDLIAYDASICNNIVVQPATAQGLAWEAWHHIEIAVDHGLDRWLWIAVDGVIEDLSMYAPERSEVAPCDWRRGQLLETLHLQIVPSEWLDESGPTPVLWDSEDEVYWDNPSVTTAFAGASNINLARLQMNGIGTIYEPGPFLVQVPSAFGQLTLTWGGAAQMPLILIAGVPNTRALAVPGLGSIDIGTRPYFFDTFVVFDGTQPTIAPFFTTDPGGYASQTFTLPLLPVGQLGRFQGLMLTPPGLSTYGALLTAAFDLEAY